jgi:hypothetical protein
MKGFKNDLNPGLYLDLWLDFLSANSKRVKLFFKHTKIVQRKIPTRFFFDYAVVSAVVFLAVNRARSFFNFNSGAVKFLLDVF